MLSVDEARARILRPFAPLPSEWVPLSAAHGRVLAEDLVAGRDHPPDAVSAMDGYAIRAADLQAGEARLQVIGEAPAGHRFAGEIGPGEAVRIFTGGSLPAGADAIAIQEHAQREGGQVILKGAVAPGAHVREAGLDFRAGEIGLMAGRRLTARDLGLAAAMNHGWVRLRRRPQVALLATGDELVRPGAAFGPDNIVSSSPPALAAMIAAFGGEAVDLGIVRDDPKALADRAADFAGVDLVVTLGGASVGEHDLIRSTLGDEGLDLDFWQIAMRPGKPLLFGHIRGVPLLGLPGNPVSAGVCTILFVRAVIRRLVGLDPTLDLVPAVLGRALPPNDAREEYLRATGRRVETGDLEVVPASRQDSSMFATFTRATHLVRRPAHAPALATGTPVEAIPLDAMGLGI